MDAPCRNTSTTEPAPCHWTIGPDQIESGDVVVLARPSLERKVARFVGDAHHHAGVVGPVAGELAILSTSRKTGPAVIPLEGLFRYDSVQVVRLPVERSVRHQIGVEAAHMITDVRYSLVQLIVSFLLSWARKGPKVIRVGMTLLALAAVAWMPLRKRQALMCSAFVVHVVDRIAPGALVPRLGRAKTSDQSGPAAPASELDRVLSKALATPSDIWRSVGPEFRFEVCVDPAAPKSAEPETDGTSPSSAASDPVVSQRRTRWHLVGPNVLLSVGTAMANAGIFALFAVRGVPGWMATLVSAALVLVPKFVISRRWIWRQATARPVRQAMRFFGISGAFAGAVALLTVVAEHAGASSAVLIVTNVGGYGLVWLARFVVIDRLVFGRSADDETGRETPSHDKDELVPNRVGVTESSRFV